MALKMRYGIISDTHGHIAGGVFDVFQGVIKIFHCGDVGSMDCIVELETIAPVLAVAGNMDHGMTSAELPGQYVESELFGVVVMMHGTPFGHHNDTIIRGMRQHFASFGPRVMLFGHSHMPLVRDLSGLTIINPGSASLPKAGARPTVALMEYDASIESIYAEIAEV